MKKKQIFLRWIKFGILAQTSSSFFQNLILHISKKMVMGHSYGSFKIRKTKMGVHPWINEFESHYIWVLGKCQNHNIYQCWVGIPKEKWKPTKVLSWFSPWMHQGITKGDALFETYIKVLMLWKQIML